MNKRVERTLELDATPTEPGDPFAPGATLGHFLVRRVIGEGGMGIVLEAFDPDLDRTVAIKVVGEDRRLLKEAQAMARLAHPNVVAVHEVGEAGGRVFLVMEHVAGRTLEAWLAAGRGWREIVRAFVQAGEGLAAAHRAGLVHRDVKPSNLLVDDAGRVRVSDFGIAIDDDEDGRIEGTPRYMAPEQAAGGAVDARADQYALGVCLRESLPANPPRRVRRAIERATANDPAARFPTLEPLLGELRAATRPRGLVVWVALGAVLLVSTLLAWPRASTPPDCGDGLADGVWTAAARRGLLADFAATARPEAGASADAVARALDDYAGAWKLGRIAACHADTAARPRRIACLDRRLDELRAQLAAWRGADAGVVDGAVRAAASLPAIDGCVDARAAPPPSALAPLYARIDAAEANQRAGKPLGDDGLVSDAEASGDSAVLAAALSVTGRAQLDRGENAAARDTQARAAREAARAGDDRAMADALLAEATSIVADGHAEEALGLIDAADAEIVRADLPDLEEAVLRRRGEALHRAGRDADAIAPLSRAVELADARAARDPSAKLSLSSALGLLADAQIGLTHYDLARPLLARGLSIEQEAYGPVHPEVATSLHDLAVCEGRLGDHDAAARDYQHAEEILIAVFGPEHEEVGLVEESLGSLALMASDDKTAATHYARARAILEKALPPDHPQLAQLYAAIAALARDDDRCGDAVPDFQRAVAGLDHAGVGGMNLATPLIGLGVCLTETHRVAEGRPPLERALTILEGEHVPLRQTVEVHAGLAENLQAAHDRAGAIAHARAGLRAIHDDPADETASYVSWFDELLKEEGAAP